MTVSAAGYVIYRLISTEIQYLLLQASYGTNHWSPPKGHVDPGENDGQTALRELAEESGIKEKHIRPIPGFEKVLNYVADNKPKRVVYYLAELLDPQQEIILSDEHMDTIWLPLGPACEITKFKETEELLRSCEEYLKSKKCKELSKLIE